MAGVGHGDSESIPFPEVVPQDKWFEILVDRLDQLEFSISAKVGAQDDVLQAIGRLGEQLDIVVSRLGDKVPVSQPSDDSEAKPSRSPTHDLDEATELLSSALDPICTSLSRLSLLVQGMASRQDQVVKALADRMDLIEAQLAPTADPTEEVDQMSLEDHLAGLEDRLSAKLASVLDRPLPRPDLTPVHQSVARIGTAMKAYAEEQQRIADQTTARLGRIEEAISAFAGPRPSPA